MSMLLLGTGGITATSVSTVPVTVFNQTASLTVFDPAWQGFNQVLVLTSSLLSSATGQYARFTWLFSSGTSSGILDNAYVARQSTAGGAEIFDFSNTPSQIQWAGATSLTGISAVSSATTFVSDFVLLPETFDNTKTYLVAQHCNSSGSVNSVDGAGANGAFFKAGAAESSIVDKTGFNTYAAFSFIAKMEVSQVNS